MALGRDALARRVQVRLVGDGVLEVAQVVALVGEQLEQRDAEVGRVALDPGRVALRDQVEQQLPEARVVLGQVVERRLARARPAGSRRSARQSKSTGQPGRKLIGATENSRSSAVERDSATVPSGVARPAERQQVAARSRPAGRPRRRARSRIATARRRGDARRRRSGCRRGPGSAPGSGRRPYGVRPADREQEVHVQDVRCRPALSNSTKSMPLSALWPSSSRAARGVRGSSGRARRGSDRGGRRLVIGSRPPRREEALVALLAGARAWCRRRSTSSALSSATTSTRCDRDHVVEPAGERALHEELRRGRERVGVGHEHQLRRCRSRSPGG